MVRSKGFLLVLAAGIGWVVAGGCGSGEKAAPEAETPAAKPPPAATAPAPEKTGAPTDTAAAEGLQIFQTRCSVCHGMEGRGDGPGAAGLDPKPRNFHDSEWQASVTDDYLAKIIQFGGAAVGKSPLMPGNPDLVGRADVVKAIVAHIRSLGKS